MACLTTTVPAHAQGYPIEDIDIDLYKPIVTRKGAFHARGATALHPKSFGLAAWLQYVHNPLVWRGADGTTYPFVKGQWMTILGAAWAPFSWLEVQAVLPFLTSNTRPSSMTDVSPPFARPSNTPLGGFFCPCPQCHDTIAPVIRAVRLNNLYGSTPENSDPLGARAPPTTKATANMMAR